MDRLSSRLASRTGDRQDGLLAQADAAANALDRDILRVWKRLMALLKSGPHPFHVHRQALDIARAMHATLHDSLHGHLTALARTGYDQTRRILGRELPAGYLHAALRRKRPALAIRGRARESRLLEDDDPLQRGGIDIGTTIQDLLFPPLDVRTINRFLATPIAGSTWVQDLSVATRLAPADRIADLLVSGLSRGLTPAQIARTLQPVVQGVQSSARRIARTYGMQVAHAAQQEAHEQLGDLLIGYQINALKDQWTRPWHRERSGTIYYKEPKSGQKGMAQMPHPPLEAEDPSERPAGAPRTAWNCRCVTGRSLIHADVRSIARATYDGEVFEFRTRSGTRLAVTANHPMATPEGFVAAHCLCEGDYLISDGISICKFAGHIEDDVLSVEDAFQSLAMRGGIFRLQRPSFLEFHGDGTSMHGEVYVVGANLCLMPNSNPFLAQNQNQGNFIGRASLAMSGPGLPSSLQFRHARPLYHFGRNFYCLGQSDRFRFCAEHDPAMIQPLADGAAFDATHASDSVARFSTQISLNHIGGRRVAPSQSGPFSPRANMDAEANECLAEAVSRQAELVANLRARHAGLIGPDRIVSVCRFHLRTWVYSVDTGLGYYMGSDNIGPAVLQGNCHLSPVLRHID